MPRGVFACEKLALFIYLLFLIWAPFDPLPWCSKLNWELTGAKLPDYWAAYWLADGRPGIVLFARALLFRWFFPLFEALAISIYYCGVVELGMMPGESN